jgi:Na+-transporting methylmalonyl-CoA/oxaloacetate decarboxylase gamma subunit
MLLLCLQIVLLVLMLLVALCRDIRAAPEPEAKEDAKAKITKLLDDLVPPKCV